MNTERISGKTIKEWQKTLPLIRKIMAGQEVFWRNPEYRPVDTAFKSIALSYKDVADAQARLKRFAPFIAEIFPQTREGNGIIESLLREIHNMKKLLNLQVKVPVRGTLLLKCDNLLAVSGSIKARGGIYEVLKTAETLAVDKGLLGFGDDYAILATDKFKRFFSNYAIAVGSTGNLGLSIGIVGAALGFKVYVHMSADAALWKKQRLRQCGVTVVEYETDYSQAVAAGRQQARSDPNMHFIDDENSLDLLLGYAVAADRLKEQFDALGRVVDEKHPLFVYLPCGVGGGPGGITLGLKFVFGDHVHCFFAEPTASPCMLIGLMTGLHDKVSVQDFGLSNITDADGLAVGRPSGLVGKTLGSLISGSYSVADKTLYRLLHTMADQESIFLEPSAVAGLTGPTGLLNTPEGRGYLHRQGVIENMSDATHLVWATGGGMVPEPVMQAYYAKGAASSAYA
ncbi:D-serine ammonia-lyase [Desulfobacter hydrogenophilus]|uniref:Probable D-serine dehydratase n=1 Tax=Desulfobacter hydrogenophilus TaxID=2291 RepID=A0A328F8W2_9BACT|nr:D-serine ammonia-lyase [Desulfobacter hydrogenophilus]NDY72914.1 D-serine ammonia-lyase [Desulfobacter hydrogenophilus]QBH11828.1 D-serine ammonia-lyase [Desulfobacter hydrogenophilus]RAM01058.1 D-serine ammonia-lyase [Desulfobacter hydrogenophilus]